jgi:hypothetical protein
MNELRLIGVLICGYHHNPAFVQSRLAGKGTSGSERMYNMKETLRPVVNQSKEQPSIHENPEIRSLISPKCLALEYLPSRNI